MAQLKPKGKMCDDCIIVGSKFGHGQERCDWKGKLICLIAPLQYIL